MYNVKRVEILGCPFDAVSFEEAVASIEHAVVAGRRIQVVPGSIDTVMKARHNMIFADDVRNADLIVADGVPIVWAASLLGDPLRRRVSGTDLVWSCAELSARMGFTVALIGGMPGVGKRAADVLRQRFPKATLCALETPFPLGPDQSRALADKLRELDVRIVLVALGAPRQEQWIRTYLERSAANVGIGIGGAFDIISGDMPRAPRILRDNGFEWLHRMMQEPGRLVKRYLVEDSPFLFYLTLELLKNKLCKRGGESDA